MGKRLAKLFFNAGQSANKSGKELEKATGIAQGLLSDYQNNRKTPPFAKLARLARGYGLAYAQVVRCWMEDELATQKDRDALIVEVLGDPASTPQSPFPVMLDSLRANRDVHRAAEKVLNHFEQGKALLDASTHTILEALLKIPQLKVVGGRAPRAFNASAADWMPVQGASYWEKQRVFVAKGPTPVVAELHRVPMGMGGAHRQCDSLSRPAYYELWSVVQGTGLLLVERDAEQEQWDEIEVSIGACGYYFGAHRHVWLNTSDAEPLILFHLFFPYRSMDPMDEAVEFEVSEPGETVPAVLRTKINAVMTKRNSAMGDGIPARSTTNRPKRKRIARQ